MIDVLIQGVDYYPPKRSWRIAQQVTEPDGSSRRHLHVIPDYAVVNHAAEYALDPGDSRAVVDWLLHERFGAPCDPAHLCPYRNAPRTAWARHQERLDEIRTRVRITDPDGHLEKIHNAHNPGPEEVEAAAARTAAVRAHVANLTDNKGIRHG